MDTSSSDLTGGLSPAVAAWLTSSVGLAAVAEVPADLDAVEERGEDPRTAELRVATAARQRWPEPGRASAVVAAAVGRRRARSSWPCADRLLFTRTALEQASSFEVASWRAARYGDDRRSGTPVWDLCAGIGADALALAGNEHTHVVAVDLDEARLRLLDHNARALGRDVVVEVADALEVRPPPEAWLHADPGRRLPDGRRVRHLAAYRPAVPDLVAAHGSAPAIGIVLSPAVALDDPDLPLDAELEFISVGSRLVEAVAWLGELASPGVVASATILDPPGQDHVRGHAPRVAAVHPPRFPPPEEQGMRAADGTPYEAISIARAADGPFVLPVGSIGGHLVQANPAAVRARLHDTIGATIGARRVARHRALLTTDDPPPVSRWYDARPVLAVLPARPRAVRDWLRGRDTPPIELAGHGVDLDVASWWRGIGRPPRGPRGWRIELIRLDEGAVAVVTDDRRG